MLTQSDIYFQQPWWPVKIKVYQGYHLGFCAGKQPIWSYLSSPLCLICLSSPSSVLFLCLTWQQKVVCPKVSGEQSSDLLENPLGLLLTSCMKCESWVIHRVGEGSILKQTGFFCLTTSCSVTSRELMEVLSAAFPCWLCFSRDGGHQMLTFMWEAAEGKKACWPSCSSPGQLLFF